ncbi:MAG: 6-bladed beta-propeller [Acidobacteriota bacterium]
MINLRTARMRSCISRATVFLSVGCFFCGSSFLAGDKKEFSLREELSIGVESGDDNFMFGDIASIDLDSAGNIYILDWKDLRVQKFNEKGEFLKSIVLKKGQGPEEVATLAGVAVGPNGMIAVLDHGGSKVILLSPDGEFIRFLKRDFLVNHLAFLPGERLVALGLNDEKMLHVLDLSGNLLASFGEPFEVPTHLSKYKDMPLLRCPMRFSVSPSGRIFLYNPHKFEISVYNEGKLEKKLPGKSDLYVPARVPQASSQRIALVFPFLTVLEFGDRLYVTVLRVGAKGPNELIVYEKDRRVGSLQMSGMPRAIDQQGRLYCALETDFPRMVRYTLEER